MGKSKVDIKSEYLYNTYGITIAEWASMMAVGCLLCGSVKRLAVDHLHVKNFKKLRPEEKREFIRGPLCWRCNKFTVGSIEIHKNAREILFRLNLYFSIYPIKGDKT